MRNLFLLSVFAIACGNACEPSNSSQPLISEEGPAAECIYARLNGFSGAGIYAELDLVSWTISGWQITPFENLVRRIEEPTVLPPDLRDELEAALAGTQLLHLTDCGYDGTDWDGDFPFIDVGEERYSTHPTACDALAFESTDPFDVVVRAFQVLDPEAEELTGELLLDEEHHCGQSTQAPGTFVRPAHLDE